MTPHDGGRVWDPRPRPDGRRSDVPFLLLNKVKVQEIQEILESALPDPGLTLTMWGPRPDGRRSDVPFTVK